MSIALVATGLLSKAFLKFGCRDVCVKGLDGLLAALDSGKGVLTGQLHCLKLGNYRLLIVVVFERTVANHISV
jgi:hypothetical protein